MYFYDYQDGSGNIYRGNNQNGEASKASQSISQSNLNWDDLFSLAENCGLAFQPSYLPIIEKRASQTYSSKNLGLETKVAVEDQEC